MRGKHEPSMGVFGGGDEWRSETGAMFRRTMMPRVRPGAIMNPMINRPNNWEHPRRAVAVATPKGEPTLSGPEKPRSIYLDWNASAPLDPRVAEVMISSLSKVGNAASAHAYGSQQAGLVDQARAQVAALVGGRPSGVVFTASATEANNLAICGPAHRADQERRRILVSAVEHASVIKAAEWLHDRGIVQVDVIPATKGGFVTPGAVSRLLGPDVLLVSVMAANGETGVFNPIADIAELAHANGSLYHCDATQFAGRVPLVMDDFGIDLVSVSAHKLGGPMGVGALIGTRRALAGLDPVIHGGGHERGLRSGSLNVPGIVGFGEAAWLAALERAAEAGRVTQLRDSLTGRISAALSGVEQIGDVARRLPNTACMRFRGADGEAVAANLEPVAASTGSACTSGSVEPSRTLLAMGLSREAAFECLRFSLGRSTTEDDVAFAAHRAVEAVQYVREMAGQAV